MNALLYYILRPIIYLASRLPYPLLYAFSNFLNILVFKIFDYRGSVIRKNLSNSFPDKSKEELKRIERAFNLYFCDLTLETLKTLTISPEKVKKRVKFTNPELIAEYAEKGQSVVLVMGHFGNWELAGARFALDNKHKLIVIYHPLQNKKFNELIVHMRTRLGNELYAKSDVLRGMVRDRKRLTATAFIADQTPFPENAYWTTFLNQDTPIFTGTEKIASKFGYPVLYVSVKRPKRGHYTIELEKLFENPGETTENEISEAHTKRLEKDILECPEIWLWSHKRWKYKKTID